MTYSKSDRLIWARESFLSFMMVAAVLTWTPCEAVEPKPQSASTARAKELKVCIAQLTTMESNGDAQASKLLASHFDDGKQQNAHLALQHLKKAIELGADLSDLRKLKAEDVLSYCRSNSEPSPKSVESPPLLEPVVAMPKPATSKPLLPEQVIEKNERLALEAEAKGSVKESLHYWELARGAGSKTSARRLFDIYSLGSGDVDPDYAKAVDAARKAQPLGVTLPKIARKE